MTSRYSYSIPVSDGEEVTAGLHVSDLIAVPTGTPAWVCRLACGHEGILYWAHPAQAQWMWCEHVGIGSHQSIIVAARPLRP